MVIKKLIESTPNSLNILGVGKLTPFELSSLTPVSKRIEFNLQLMSNKKIYVT